MASKSQSDVFGTTELLENILLHLDLKTLLVSSQLYSNKRYSSGGIIPGPTSDEPAFTKALGSDNSDSDDSFAVNRKTTETIIQPQPAEMNPLLQEKFPLFFYDARRDDEATRPMGGDTARRNAYLRYRRRTRTCTLMAKYFRTRLPLGASEAARAAFMRPEASWRNMLVAQPPLRDIGFTEERHGMGGVGYRFAELRLSDDENGCAEEGWGGLHMGALYDAAASWFMGPHPSFGIMWVPANFHFPTVGDSVRRTRQVNQEEKSALAGRVDVLLTLGHSSVCTKPTGAAKEQIERNREEFRARFVHPGARREASLQSTKSMRWKKHRMDGTEVWEKFGWPEY
ncbi:uncharacterized protein PG986_004922 [Apiospora aurea]|uniref:F-box domain-containing protein n=1 Tax=Apiospora aurea TaxID=335848 RepID=A0ABR1QG43_9PEZI